MPLREWLVFGQNFFHHPKLLGSLIPSSRFVTRRLLDQVDWERTRVIVEYGPGLGNVSERLAERLHADGKLILIELNPGFIEPLRRKFIHDSRVRIFHDSAENVRALLHELGIERSDYVVSGIPYAVMPARVRRKILAESRSVLHPDGAFLAYQFSSRVRRELEPVFGVIHEEFEPRNILPARLFYCTP